MSEERMRREARPIRNRDILKLARMTFTLEGLKATEQKRLWMQDRLWNVTQKLTGMPGGHGSPAGLEAPFAEISEMEEKYAAECATFMRELMDAEMILSRISNGAARTFVTMKYVFRMSRREIMAKLALKKWQYNALCNAIEQAESMADVEWDAKCLPHIG